MHLKIVLLALLIFGWTNLATAILLLNVAMALFGKKYFAGFCSNFSKMFSRLHSSSFMSNLLISSSNCSSIFFKQTLNESILVDLIFDNLVCVIPNDTVIFRQIWFWYSCKKHAINNIQNFACNKKFCISPDTDLLIILIIYTISKYMSNN